MEMSATSGQPAICRATESVTESNAEVCCRLIYSASARQSAASTNRGTLAERRGTARQVPPPSCQATAHAKPPPTRRRHPRHALPTRCRRPTRRALSRSEQHIVTQRHAARPTQSHTSRCQNSAATYRGDRTARPQRLSAPSVSAPGGYRLPRCAPETTTTCPTCPACPVPAPLRAPATWAGRPPSHSWPELWR